MSYLVDAEFTRGSDGSLDCAIVETDVKLIEDRPAVKQRCMSRSITRLSRWVANPWLGTKLTEAQFGPMRELENAMLRADLLRALRQEPWIEKNRILVKVAQSVSVECRYLDGQPLAFEFTLGEE